jgi:hypothetical protein
VKDHQMRINAIRFLASIEAKTITYRGVPFDQFNAIEQQKIAGLISEEKDPAPFSTNKFEVGDYAKVLTKNCKLNGLVIHIDSISGEICYTHIPGDLYTRGFYYTDLDSHCYHPDADPVLCDLKERFPIGSKVTVTGLDSCLYAQYGTVVKILHGGDIAVAFEGRGSIWLKEDQLKPYDVLVARPRGQDPDYTGLQYGGDR